MPGWKGMISMVIGNMYCEGVCVVWLLVRAIVSTRRVQVELQCRKHPQSVYTHDQLRRQATQPLAVQQNHESRQQETGAAAGESA